MRKNKVAAFKCAEKIINECGAAVFNGRNTLPQSGLFHDAGGFQYIYSSYRAFKLNEDAVQEQELSAVEQRLRVGCRAGVANILYNASQRDDDILVDMPTAKALKDFIKQERASGRADKQNPPVYMLDKVTAVNANYLLDVLTMLPDVRTASLPRQLDYPIYFYSKEYGEGILMPRRL